MIFDMSISRYPYKLRESEFPDGSIGVITVLSDVQLQMEITAVNGSVTLFFAYTALTPETIYKVVQQSAAHWLNLHQISKNQAIANGARVQ